jgi:type IV pilus assembly protein PilF
VKKFICVICCLLVACATPGKSPHDDTAARHRAKIHADLGYGYFEQKQMQVSLDEFHESIRQDPSYPVPYAGLGFVHAALGQDDLAEKNFKRSLELDPQNSETHNNYGIFLCARSRYDESIKEFMIAVKNPLYATPGIAYLNAGVCAIRKKDDKNAEAYLRQALDLQPSLKQANYHLATVYFERGDYFLARHYLQRAMDDVEPTAEMLWLGVRIEHNLGGGDTEASYRILLKNKFPDSAQTRAMLSGE